MPCDTIQITTLNVEKMRPDLLQKALESMGWTVRSLESGALIGYKHGSTVKIANGRAQMTEGAAADELQANLQKAYSREVVSESAKRAGFKVQKTADYQLKLTRGY